MREPQQKTELSNWSYQIDLAIVNRDIESAKFFARKLKQLYEKTGNLRAYTLYARFMSNYCNGRKYPYAAYESLISEGLAFTPANPDNIDFFLNYAYALSACRFNSGLDPDQLNEKALNIAFTVLENGVEQTSLDKAMYVLFENEEYKSLSEIIKDSYKHSPVNSLFFEMNMLSVQDRMEDAISVFNKLVNTLPEKQRTQKTKKDIYELVNTLYSNYGVYFLLKSNDVILSRYFAEEDLSSGLYIKDDHKTRISQTAQLILNYLKTEHNQSITDLPEELPDFKQAKEQILAERKEAFSGLAKR